MAPGPERPRDRFGQRAGKALPPGATALGVDIGGTNLRVARVSAGGAILDWQAERISRGSAELIERIVALCRRLNDPSVAGIGVGVPGRVDAVTRSVLSAGYLDLAGVPLAEQLAESLKTPVVIDNDGTMALVGERAGGAAQGFDNVVMFTIGTGIGGAIVLDGHIVRGRATAGQLGHLTVSHDGLACVCGRSGCVETTSSGTALGRLTMEAGLPPGTLAEALLEREATGDELARRVLDAWIKPLRAAIDTIVAAVDPERVVLGGGLGAVAHRALARAPALSPWYRCEVVAAQLGDRAGVIGGAISALADGLDVMHPSAAGALSIAAGASG